MVAKSFQGLKQLTDPYKENGKEYVTVETKTGKTRKVRWYSTDEYCRMYPDADKNAIAREYDSYWHSLEYVLMGSSGFVWVFEGDPTPYLEELYMSRHIWYNTTFGWFIKGEEDESIVEAAREWFVVHKLEWKEISIDDNSLRADAKKIIDDKCNGKVARKYVAD